MCFFIEKICNPLFNSIKAVKNYATGAKNVNSQSNFQYEWKLHLA